VEKSRASIGAVLRPSAAERVAMASRHGHGLFRLAAGQDQLRQSETQEGESHPLEPFRYKNERIRRHLTPAVVFTFR
jgi:hypothetical protein